MSSACDQINTELLLTLLVNFTVSSPSLTDTVTPMWSFLIFFVAKATKIHFPSWREKCSSWKASCLTSWNGVPIHWNLCSFYHQKYHQRHHTIHLQSSIQQAVSSLPLYFSASLQKDLLFPFLRFNIFFYCNVSTSFLSVVSVKTLGRPRFLRLLFNWFWFCFKKWSNLLNGSWRWQNWSWSRLSSIITRFLNFWFRLVHYIYT
jgi:hypothetical protein